MMPCSQLASRKSSGPWCPDGPGPGHCMHSADNLRLGHGAVACMQRLRVTAQVKVGCPHQQSLDRVWKSVCPACALHHAASRPHSRSSPGGPGPSCIPPSLEGDCCEKTISANKPAQSREAEIELAHLSLVNPCSSTSSAQRVGRRSFSTLERDRHPHLSATGACMHRARSATSAPSPHGANGIGRSHVAAFRRHGLEEGAGKAMLNKITPAATFLATRPPTDSPARVLQALLGVSFTQGMIPCFHPPLRLLLCANGS